MSFFRRQKRSLNQELNRVILDEQKQVVKEKKQQEKMQNIHSSKSNKKKV